MKYKTDNFKLKFKFLNAHEKCFNRSNLYIHTDTQQGQNRYLDIHLLLFHPFTWQMIRKTRLFDHINLDSKMTGCKSTSKRQKCLYV